MGFMFFHRLPLTFTWTLTQPSLTINRLAHQEKNTIRWLPAHHRQYACHSSSTWQKDVSMRPGSLTIAKLAPVCYITFSSDLRAEVQGWISLPDTTFKIFEKDLVWKWKFLFTRESLLPHGVFNLPLCNVVSHWHGSAGLAWQQGSLDSFYVLYVSTAGATDCLLL